MSTVVLATGGMGGGGYALDALNMFACQPRPRPGFGQIALFSLAFRLELLRSRLSANNVELIRFMFPVPIAANVFMYLYLMDAAAAAAAADGGAAGCCCLRLHIDFRIYLTLSAAFHYFALMISIGFGPLQRPWTRIRF